MTNHPSHTTQKGKTMTSYDYNNPGPGPYGTPPKTNPYMKYVPWAILGSMILVIIIIALYNSGTFESEDEEGYATPQETYLALLELDQPHTFASDRDAIDFGNTICVMLDDYYVEYIASIVAQDNQGVLRGVSNQSKGTGIAAAATVLCPQHFDEVYAWWSS